MAKFTVLYTKTIIEEQEIEASTFDEAQAKWEEKGLDAELYSIADEHGMTLFYN